MAAVQAAEDLRGGDVDEDGRDVARFGLGAERVEEQVLDRVRRQIAQLRHAAVAGEAGGVAHEAAEAGWSGCWFSTRVGASTMRRPDGGG